MALTKSEERAARRVADNLKEIIDEALPGAVGDVDPRIADKILFGEDDTFIEEFEAKVFKLLAQNLY